MVSMLISTSVISDLVTFFTPCGMVFFCSMWTKPFLLVGFIQGNHQNDQFSIYIVGPKTIHRQSSQTKKILNQPSKQIFRRPFNQASLVNTKHSGEPIFEHDFPPHLIPLGKIQNPKAAKTIQFELQDRLATQQSI